MIITCEEHEWDEAVTWFRSETTKALLAKKDLEVTRYDHENHEVHVEESIDSWGIRVCRECGI